MRSEASTEISKKWSSPKVESKRATYEKAASSNPHTFFWTRTEAALCQIVLIQGRFHIAGAIDIDAIAPRVSQKNLIKRLPHTSNQQVKRQNIVFGWCRTERLDFSRRRAAICLPFREKVRTRDLLRKRILG